MREQFRAIRPAVWGYIFLAYLSTFCVDFFIIQSGESVYEATSLVALRMWMPGVIAIAFSLLIKRDKFFTLLKTLPKIRYVTWSYFLPVWIGLVSLIFLKLLGITEVGPRTDLIQKYNGLVPFLNKALIYSPTIGLIIPFMACIGEELGWRGYLFPATENLDPLFRKIFNGVIWAIYHWPLILFSDYATSSNRLYSLVLFSIFIIAQAVIICSIQERSRSIWTSVLFHAVHNLWIIGILPGFYVVTEATPFFIGEGGLFLTVVYVLAAWLVLYQAHKYGKEMVIQADAYK